MVKKVGKGRVRKNKSMREHGKKWKGRKEQGPERTRAGKNKGQKKQGPERVEGGSSSFENVV